MEAILSVMAGAALLRWRQDRRGCRPPDGGRQTSRRLLTRQPRGRQPRCRRISRALGSLQSARCPDPLHGSSKTQNRVEDISKDAMNADSFEVDKQEPGIGPELLVLCRQCSKHRSQPNLLLAQSIKETGERNMSPFGRDYR